MEESLDAPIESATVVDVQHQCDPHRDWAFGVKRLLWDLSFALGDHTRQG